MRSFKMAASIIVKNNSKSVFRYLFCKKLFSSTACLNDALKDSKMMQKFLQKKQRKKSIHWTGPLFKEAIGTPLGMKGKKKGFSVGMERRASHVNRTFHETISQIIANGELGVYLDITEVKIIPDFSGVLVYWEAKGTEEDTEVERILQEKAGYIRSLMIKSNQLGRIPKITFLKDTTYTKMQHLEHLLRIVELPVPKMTEITEAEIEERNNELLHDEMNTDEDDNEESDISVDNPDKTSSDETEKLTEDLHLRQDLYGLNHDVLMQKIVAMKSSSRNRLQQPVDFNNSEERVLFSENVRKFKRAVSGSSKDNDDLKKYSKFFRKKDIKGRQQRYTIVDAVLNTSEKKHVDDLQNELEYDLESGFEEDYDGAFEEQEGANDKFEDNDYEDSYPRK